ncbi:restriction endonuclease subunit S (plasmid) [Lactiplantibacillus pentosus]|uniref:restriction endonuclease subunit S n=1 Tax=Lactiplantibacillus pentosus TaxID=1589 RepID=UPI001F618187|nr:restriction endonuclease subunit S [Lactiplantibacillus pentosus]
MKDNQAKYPQLRFKGFTDPWEQRKLIEVADYRNGKAHEKDISENGDYIVVNSKFVSTNGAVKKFSDELIAPLKKGELAFVLSDVPNGRAIARTFLIDEDDKYSLNQRIAGITPHSDTNSYFLHSLMNRHHYFLRFDDGAGQTNLSKKEVENWTELYPSIEEQDKIGSFFKQLDDTITLHQRKLAKLKELKQGYLQKLFPKNGSKFPQLRFAGFADAWEERKLSEIVDIYDGTHQTPIYTDSGVKFVSVENISNLETKKYISQEAYNKEYAKKQAQKGDVLMTRIGDIGTSRVIETEEPLAYYVTLSLLKPKKIESNFLSWLISSPEVQRNIWKRTLHIAFPKKINLGEINQVEVMIPKNKEQQKIGSFFKQLDNTITLHQRKLEKLQELKKGYLQKMFC